MVLPHALNCCFSGMLLGVPRMVFTCRCLRPSKLKEMGLSLNLASPDHWVFIIFINIHAFLHSLSLAGPPVLRQPRTVRRAKSIKHQTMGLMQKRSNTYHFNTMCCSNT